MKKKKIITICGLSALCIAVLAGVYLLNREPESSFVPTGPESVIKTDTWTDNAENSLFVPSLVETENSQTKGSASDQTQTMISEDENGSVTSLSDSTARSEAEKEKPQEKPVTVDDTKDKDNQPEYEPASEATNDDNLSDKSNSGNGQQTDGDNPAGNDHPGQIYDPVFGWLETGNTSQDTIDSDGDINKQIGVMGGN